MRVIDPAKVRIGAFVLAGGGLLVVPLTPGATGIAAAMAITSLGTGSLLPGLVTSAVDAVPPSRRGQGIGWWWSSIYLGQFASPLVVVALSEVLGGLAAVVVAVGGVSVATALFLVFVPATPRPTVSETVAVEG